MYGAVGRRRLPVPAGVVGEHPVPLGQRRHLRRPTSPGSRRGSWTGRRRARPPGPSDGVGDGDGGHAAFSSVSSGVLGEDGVDLRAGLADVGSGAAQQRGARRRRCARAARRASGRPVAARLPHGVGGRVVRGRRGPRDGVSASASAPASSGSRGGRHRGGHPGGVHPQPGEALGQPGRRRPDGGEQRGQGGPLAVPGAGGPLVLLLHRAEQRGRPAPGARRAQARAEIAATGLCLCGIAEEPPRRSATSADLADLGLGQQHDVDGDRGDHPGRRAERPGEVGDRQPHGVPGRRRWSARPSSAGERRAQRRRPTRRWRRACPTAPPYCTGSDATTVGQPGAGAVQAGQPAGRLQPERRRQRLLHQGAAHDDVVAVRRAASPAAAAGGGRRGRRRSRRSRAGRAAPARCRATSWLVAPTCTATASRSAHRVLQHPHQRRHRVAGVGRLRHDRREVQPAGVGAGGGDRVGRRRSAPARPRRPRGPAPPRRRAARRNQAVVGDGRGRSPARERAVEESGHARIPVTDAFIPRRTPSRARPAGGCRSR